MRFITLHYFFRLSILIKFLVSRKIRDGWNCESSSSNNWSPSCSSYDNNEKKLICKEVDDCSDRRRYKRRGQNKRCVFPPQPCPLPPCPPQPCPLPPCPPQPCPLPPCPPQPWPCPPCPPQPWPCPPQPCPYPDQEKCSSVLGALDQLLAEKSTDLAFIITSKGQQFINAVKDSMANAATSLGNQVTSANNSLNNVIQGLLTSSNSSLTAAIIGEVNTANATLLSGINSLVATANSSVSTLITTLAAQLPATITATVQDLTSPTGLLQQLLSINSTLSSSIAALFALTGPAEIAAITNTLNNSSSALSSQITSAINATNTAILQQIAQIFMGETAYIVDLFNRFLDDIILGSEGLLADYGYEVNRIVREALGCRGYTSNPSLRPSSYSKQALRPPVPNYYSSQQNIVPLNPVIGSNSLSMSNNLSSFFQNR